MKGGSDVPNIKPVSDLRNYGEVLRDVAVWKPVFLTKNGHGRTLSWTWKSTVSMKSFLQRRGCCPSWKKGRRSGENDGWLDEVNF